jgi:hypothetical protein
MAKTRHRRHRSKYGGGMMDFFSSGTDTLSSGMDEAKKSIESLNPFSSSSSSYSSYTPSTTSVGGRRRRRNRKKTRRRRR